MRLRFYGELNDFLPPERRGVEFTCELTRRTSIKDLIESLGVPHTEVEVILVNGRSVDFSHIVEPDDRIAVYPELDAPHAGPLIRLRGPLRRPPRFVVDANLGQLARHLRLLGFDTLYRNNFTDREIARIAHDEQRFILTRDRGLLRHKIITSGRFVRAVKPRAQAREVLAHLGLHTALQPFTRCLRCNGELEDVEKDRVLHQLESRTRQYYERFRRCRTCGQAYWQGSHFRRMQQLYEYFATPPATG